MLKIKPLRVALFSFSVVAISAVYAQSTTLKSMSDEQLSETTGQALMSLTYVAPTDSANMEAKRTGGDKRANSNMRCDSLKSLMIINKLSKFL